MKKHNLKKYMVALSTVGILNSACIGSNRLGMDIDGEKSTSNGRTTDKSRAGIKEALEAKEANGLVACMALSGLSNDQGEFKKLLKYIGDKHGENVLQVTPTWRSRKCLESSSVTNDMYYSIDTQAKEVFEEYKNQICKTLREVYKWSQENIDKEWKNLPLVIIGSSQGGLVAFKFYEKYQHILNIKRLQYVGVPAMGLDIFERKLVEIQDLKSSLRVISNLLHSNDSKLIDTFYSVLDKAVQSGFETSLLGELLNSHNEDREKHAEFEKKLGEDYINLVDSLKDYRGILDMNPCAKQMWAHLRADKAGNRSETNNNGEPAIDIVASDVGNDMMSKAIQIADIFLGDISSSVKSLHGLNKDDEINGSDGVLSVANQLCKRRNSFSEVEEKFAQTTQNTTTKRWGPLSRLDLKKLGYRHNVDHLMIFHSCAHSGLHNIFPTLPLSVFENPKCFTGLTMGLSKLVPPSTMNTTTEQTSNLHVEDDLD